MTAANLLLHHLSLKQIQAWFAKLLLTHKYKFQLLWKPSDNKPLITP